eukprot:5311564-Lingulodinium_polyedra.AAC.1
MLTAPREADLATVPQPTYRERVRPASQVDDDGTVWRLVGLQWLQGRVLERWARVVGASAAADAAPG